MKLAKEQETKFINDAIEYLHQICVEVKNTKEIEIISIKMNELNDITEIKFRYKNYIIVNDGKNWGYYLLKELK